MSKLKGMTQSQWDAWLASVLDRARKRVERLEAARSGDVRFRTVKVEAYNVRAYKVGAHTRIIEDRRATRKQGAAELRQRARAQLRVLKGGE